MIQLLKKLFGTKHQRDLKILRPLVERVNFFEEQYQSLSDDQLRGKTDEFKHRLAQGQTLDDIMCEAFAAVKNACRRMVGKTVEVSGHELVWDMIPFDVQIMGGIALHQGRIAEMATGEGKTLVATMPLYLNALTGRNVNLVTVNDYLARRDAQWMGYVYQFLGLTVGCIQNHMDHEQRRAEYAKDITYGTNSEFGFDYLRDNGMAWAPDQQVQRGYYYAIVDEVDSILIDEARTPLIISGPAPVSTHQYNDLKPRVEELVRLQRAQCNVLVQEAKDLLDKGDTERAQRKLYQVYHGMPKHKQLMHLLEDPAVRKLHEQVESMMITDMRKEEARELREVLYFNIDERHHDAGLTEKGCEAMNPNDPNMFVLPDLISAMSTLDGDKTLTEQERARKRVEIQENFAARSERIQNVDQLIRAYCLYERDVEYVVQDNQVLIVDEFTGRILPGRRWSDGLHQAVEAKEGVKVERETQTLATITIQNYFRMYEKLAGMTGTAETEAGEFKDIYKLDVIVIPTNRPCRRVDNNDLVYKTQREKFKALIEEITECHKQGQPVLVGTISVETSELLSRMLRRAKIPHNVLNAKNHEREAEIVAGAGHAGSVTIATNMAGRGTDIKLGEGVVWLDRALVLSQATLDAPVPGGKTLRVALVERPCGLHVIGSERHEARRIDRQLRGRCARQGDPGSSRFYVSLEDDLMRLFGSDKIAGMMSRLGLEEGQPLEHRWLNRSIETAQRRVEQQNFSIRKRTLEYDDVMNRQREIIYRLRGDIVRSEKVRERIYDMFEDAVVRQIEGMLNDDADSTFQSFMEWVQSTFPIAIRREEIKRLADNREGLASELLDRIRRTYDQKVAMEDPNRVVGMERHVLLQIIDSHWQDYLRSIDMLRQGIHLRAFGQRDPLVEYKREAFHMFEELMQAISLAVSASVFRSSTSLDSFTAFLNALPRTTVHDHVSILGQGARTSDTSDSGQTVTGGSRMPSPEDYVQPAMREGPKVGRNDPCPCGSGKKYKKCHGANAGGV
jgi:preprotein translocase subunit SecA